MIEYDAFCYNGKNVDLLDALDNAQQDLREEYDKNMLFCPECQIAQLTFTRKTSARRAFLSTRKPSLIDANNHRQDCSHLLNHATKAQTNQYYKRLSDAQVKDKLDAAINTFLRRNAAEKNHIQSNPHAQNPFAAQFVEKGIRTYKRLPLRSFYSVYDITDDELDVPILLYGEVKLKVEEAESRDGRWRYYRLVVCNRKTGRQIRWFYRANVKDVVDEKKLYFVALIAKIERENGKIRSDLYKQESVRFVEIT